MKIISWNVAGFRACLKKGFDDFFKEIDADIFCMQESKVLPEQFEYNPEGYYQYLNPAEKKGYSQVLWLDGVEQKYIEEVGSMNMMFAYGNKIVTPRLNGSILPGITRDSVLKLSRQLGFEAEEARLDVHEIFADAKSGKLTEAFGTGTAAVISPVGVLAMGNEKIVLGDGGIGPVAQKLYDTLTGIQYGRLEDVNGWITRL